MTRTRKQFDCTAKFLLAGVKKLVFNLACLWGFLFIIYQCNDVLSLFGWQWC
jgi:hypothetical protein